MRLARAHIDLAKAEAGAIKDEVVRIAILAGVAIGVLIMASILFVVGGAMFLGQWLLGSIGWGVLHGLLLFSAIAVASVLAAIGDRSRLAGAFGIGLLAAIVVSVLLALALPNQLYGNVGPQVLPGIEEGVRPLVVGVALWAILGLLVGLVSALRAEGGGARVGAAVGGLVVGAIVGALSAVDVGVQVGVGIGIAVGYVVWIALMVGALVGEGIDTDALKARFIPNQTIETSKETLAWLQSRMPPGTGS